MAGITDIILSQVKNAAGGSNLDNKVLSGISDSILGSLKNSATSADGIAQITALFTGNTSASSSPITQQAIKTFVSGAAKKLGLSDSVVNTATALIPKVITALTSKDSKLDLSSILSMVGGTSTSKSSSSGLGALAGLASKFFGK